MKYYPYGGSFSKKHLVKMSKKDTMKESDKYNRKLSLNLDHIILDLNIALQDLSHNLDLYTFQKHQKSIGILLICVSLLGLLLLYIN